MKTLTTILFLAVALLGLGAAPSAYASPLPLLAAETIPGIVLDPVTATADTMTITGHSAGLDPAQPVLVQVREPGSTAFASAGSAPLAADGSFTLSYPVGPAGTYEFNAVGTDTGGAPITSDPVMYAVQVAPSIALDPVADRSSNTGTFTVTGSTTGVHPGSGVEIQMLIPGATAYIVAGQADLAADGTFASSTIAVKQAGTYSFQAYVTDSNGTRMASAPVQAIVKQTSSITANAVAARHEGVGTFALSGKTVAVAAGAAYTIQVRYPGSSGFVTGATGTISSTGTFSSTAIKVKQAGTYTFRVVAKDVYGTSRTSNQQTATVATASLVRAATAFSGNTLVGVVARLTASSKASGITYGLQAYYSGAWHTVDTGRTGSYGAIADATYYGRNKVASYTYRAYTILPNTGRYVFSPTFRINRALPADGVRLTHSQAYALLTSNGIKIVSSGNCYDRTKPYCTGLATIFTRNIRGLLTLRKACPVTMTGGTETGHTTSTYSHWNGYKVDVAMSSCITTWVRNQPGSYLAGTKWVGKTGYRQEGGHWDIAYRP